MNNYRIIITLTCLLLYSCVNVTLAKDQERKTDLSAGLIVFPPLVSINERKQCSGEAINALKSIFSTNEFTLDIYCASPSRIYRDFNTGLIDITINVKTTSSLSNNVVFSNKPFAQLEVVLYSTKNDAPQFTSAIRSFNYHGVKDELRKIGYTFFDTARPNEAIAVFLRGGTDALLSYRRPMEFYLDSRRTSSMSKLISQRTFYETKLTSVDTFFAINKRHHKAKRIVEIINNYQDPNNRP